MTKQQFLWNLYLKDKEETVGLALADYLEENKIDMPLAIGLKFCIKYKKFPHEELAPYEYEKFGYYWFVSRTNIHKKIHSILPNIFESISNSYFEFNNPKNAIRAVGKIIITFKKLTANII